MEIFTERPAELFLITFLAITFVQSSLDKVFDWNGNLSWLKSHFEKSPLKAVVPAMFFILTITELSTGIVCVLGLVQVIRGAGDDLAFWGAALSCLSLLMLFFGQRIAKDYDGARTIAIYFVPAVLLLYLLQ
ncbi:MAG: DoxX family protein [Robiginitalea sp.]